jgi:alpha-galactosidase
MSITRKGLQFHLKSKKTSYVLSILDSKYICNLYWGEKLLSDPNLEYLPKSSISSRANAFHVPLDANSNSFLSDLKLDFSTVGSGDYRIPTVHVECADGSTVLEYEYKGYKIIKGKPNLIGLPATYVENENEAETLQIELVDPKTNLHIFVNYTVFEEYDIITRNIYFENCGLEQINLLTANSVCVDFPGINYKALNLHGDWVRERHMEYQPIGHSIINIDSKRGSSSHMNNPFVAIMDNHANEYGGNVYGFSLVYSGNFSAMIEGSSCGSTRVTMGINPFNFNWTLLPSQTFQTPEVVLAFSNCGLNEMSQKYHKLYRERLCRGKHRDLPRPMVINSWEGVGMDFDEDKLISIAKTGKSIGLELFVLDDGWFGKRNDDTSSLGDWYVNKDKLPNGLEGLAKEINSLGLKFGLWVEPEMVSPLSDLYRKNPDWCIHTPGRSRTENRSQLMLDLSKEEVCNYIIKSISNVLKSADIEYVKWDCNRNITETMSQMQSHKYILGLYKILDKLTSDFPDILFESCSGGGGRFDAGMLYYMPQTWTSDNTNPIARLYIQYGTSIVYPIVSMTAHVGKIDTGEEGRNDFLNTSAMVAMGGNFGYELDLSLFSEQEKEQAKGYVDLYRKIRNTVQFGTFYRLENPFENSNASWQFVDEQYVILFHYQTRSLVNGEERRIKLKGLESLSKYKCNDKIYFGEELMKIGIIIPLSKYEYESEIMLFEKI